MWKKIAAWAGWYISGFLLLYDHAARWLGRLSVPDDLITYIITPTRDSVLPFLRVWVTPMLTWDTARWALFMAASLTLVWVYFGDRLSSWVGANRSLPASAVDASIQELREKIRRLMLLLAGGDPNNELPNEINKLCHFIKASNHSVWRDLQLEQWRTDLLLLAPMAKNLRGSSFGLYSSRSERDDILGRLRELAEKIDAKLAGLGTASGENVSMPPSPGQAPPTPAPSHFPAGLYVGKIDVSTQLGQGAKHLDLYIKGFNATGETISVDRLSGHVTYQKPGGEVIQPTRIELRPELGRSRSIASLAEMEVVVRVPLSDELAADAVAVMDAPGDDATKKTFQLDLRALDLIARVEGDEKRSARLPIWAGVSVGKRPKSIIACRSYRMSRDAPGSV